MAKAGVSRVLVPVSNMAGLNTVISDPKDALGWRETLEKFADL